MKQTTKQVLIKFLQSHLLNDEYILTDLFYKLYAEYEFSSIDELISGIDEFFDFLKNNTHLFKYQPGTIIPSRIPKIIENARENIKSNFSGSMFEGQKTFAENINTIRSPKPLGHVLEVGAGHQPISSMYLTKYATRVSAMDSYFYLSQQALKNMNVIPITELMNENTNISEYDMVIGRAPCDAITHIVTACKKYNKPFIILLCDCKLDSSLMADTESLGWENVLPKIDPNVRFHGQYAYNFDAIPEQIKKIVIDYKPRKPLPERIENFLVSQEFLKYNNFDPDWDFE